MGGRESFRERDVRLPDVADVLVLVTRADNIHRVIGDGHWAELF